jgi:RNA polymerase sigma-70 factor (ECF subfamily)
MTASSTAPAVVVTPPMVASVTELYDRHAVFVAGFVRQLGVAAGDVEDVVHDVFVVAHRKRRAWQGHGKPTTWLCAIAVGEVRNYRRKRARRANEPLRDRITDANACCRRAEARAALQRLDGALAGLTEEQRVVFVMFELAELTSGDIARALRIPVGTVHSRLHTARRHVRAAYGEPEDGGGT